MCKWALIKLTADILLNIDNKRVTALAAIDLSAAFDTVDHFVLSKVLSTNFGVSSHCIIGLTTIYHQEISRLT